MRNRRWKSVRPGSLSDAFELCLEYGAEHRRPIKVLADLMGVQPTTLYRWLSDSSMPSNRIRQFETFCGISLVSDYLCLAQGDKVVVAIPAGKKARITELGDVQVTLAEAMSLLTKFYQQGTGLDETVAALTASLTQLAYQRSNVQKSAAPELGLFEVAA